MPTGKVKWFNAEKGFGFLSREDGDDVYVHADAVPEGVTLKPGMRVEFGIVSGRRGDQALQVTVLERPQSISARQAAARRADPEDMVVIIEDLLKLLEGIGEGYRKGRHPDARTAKPVAQLLRKVAADLEA